MLETPRSTTLKPIIPIGPFLSSIDPSTERPNLQKPGSCTLEVKGVSSPLFLPSPWPKGPMYRYSRMQGVHIRNYYYDLGKYPPITVHRTLRVGHDWAGIQGLRVLELGTLGPEPPGGLRGSLFSSYGSVVGFQGLGFRVWLYLSEYQGVPGPSSCFCMRAFWSLGVWSHSVNLRRAKWEFPKIRGTLVFWGPYNKDPTI